MFSLKRKIFRRKCGRILESQICASMTLSRPGSAIFSLLRQVKSKFPLYIECILFKWNVFFDTQQFLQAAEVRSEHGQEDSDEDGGS